MGEMTKALNTMAMVMAFEYSSMMAPFSRLGSLSWVNSLMGSFSTNRWTRARTICGENAPKKEHQHITCGTFSSIRVSQANLAGNEALDGEGQQYRYGEEHTREVHQVVIPAIVLQQITWENNTR